MTTWITASAKFGVKTSRDMDPHHPGSRIMPGIARASLHVYEPGDASASDTLPTVADLLASADATGVISIERYVGLPLRIHASALGGLSPESRVGPGESFVTDEALARGRESSTG